MTDTTTLRALAEVALASTDYTHPDYWTSAEKLAAAASPSVVLALLDVVEALAATGWNELDGKCWCETSREITKAPDHEPRCARARAALDRLEETK